MCLTSTILRGPLGLLVELWPLFGPCDSRVVVVQALCHPLTDDVHQPLEGLLHVNVVLRTRLKVLKTCPKGRQGHRQLQLHFLFSCDTSIESTYLITDTSWLWSDWQIYFILRQNIFKFHIEI